MKLSLAKSMALAVGMIVAGGAGSVALADDTEIFFNQNGGNVPANILFILDTSGSMNDLVTTQENYNPATTYAPDTCAAFNNNYYYFSATGTPPCGTTNRIPKPQFKCASMLSALASVGTFLGPFAQWGPSSSSVSSGKGTVAKPKVVTTTQTYGWHAALSAANTSGFVECGADAGVDGDGADASKLYASTDIFSVVTTTTTPPGSVVASGSVTAAQQTGVWDASKNYFKLNAGGTYTIYTANYMNWLYDSTQSTTKSKMWIMRGAASSLLSSLSGVNVGLARYNWNGTGGMIMHEIADIGAGTNRADLINLVQSWAPSSITPLSETYFEAYRYFSGGAVDFGNSSWSTSCSAWNSNGQCSSASAFPQKSVAKSRTGADINSSTYQSPMDQSCRKNFIVYLTDGLPNENDLANTDIQNLPNFATLGGKCDTTTFPGANGGKCLAALAQYMYNADLRSDVAKVQNVTSFFIGFGVDFASGGAPTAAFTYLNNAATRGGGKALTATNLVELNSAFNTILSEVYKTNTSFSAPAVAVNAFNRTQTLDDLYVSVFSPRAAYHWPGNIKKYRFLGGQVVDSTGTPAVDPNTGFFFDTARSYWSSASDGADVTLGGAASKIPDAASRTVYTYTGTTFPTALTPLTYTSVTTADLNIGAVGDPALDELVDWSRGLDTQDLVPPAGTTDSRHEMGDPIHTQPVTIIYGKNGDGTDDTVVYVPTNDGYFHALDASVNPNGTDTATSGHELWSFIPKEMLPHLKDLYANATTTTKHYGLDGTIAVLKYDINGDGTIDAAAGDRVVLIFGTGRNSDTSNYYALEVTNKTSPKLLWTINASNLPGLGQAWSTPVIAKVDIAGSGENPQKLVAVIGGGYDATEDNGLYNTADGLGNHLYMVDVFSGAKLWSAGASGANFNNARMDHAIPSSITVIDVDGDGFADHMYVGDMAAQLWRFDIANGHPAATLVTGGVIASLGTKDESTHIVDDFRRFYAPPDVSVERKHGMLPFLNIAIGSGYRGHPTRVDTHDRFYSVRDYDGLLPQTQVWFDAYTRIRDSYSSAPAATHLIDITGTVNPVIPEPALGWELTLNTHPDWTDGEKVLSPSRTFNGQVLFVTYSPSRTVVTDPCAGVGAGTNRIYAVSVFDGSPVLDQNKDGILTTNERSQDLRQSGIAPEVTFLFPPSGEVNTLVDVEKPPIPPCTKCRAPKKTYWHDGTAN